MLSSIGRAIGHWSYRAARHDSWCHNCIGHNYIHNCIGHNYMGHSYIGHNLIGHDYVTFGGAPSGWMAALVKRFTGQRIYLEAKDLFWE